MRTERVQPPQRPDLSALAAAAKAAQVLEDEAANDGTLTRAVMDRRDAAVREYHQAIDPWQPCRCYTCEPE